MCKYCVMPGGSMTGYQKIKIFHYVMPGIFVILLLLLNGRLNVDENSKLIHLPVDVLCLQLL